MSDSKVYALQIEQNDRWCPMLIEVMPGVQLLMSSHNPKIMDTALADLSRQFLGKRFRIKIFDETETNDIIPSTVEELLRRNDGQE